jgi:hypothetical protein
MSDRVSLRRGRPLGCDLGEHELFGSGDGAREGRRRARPRALYRPYFEKADAPQPRSVRQHIIASHTPVEDVGGVAAAAGVKQLVLSHLVPSAPAGAVSNEQWLAGAKKHYSGPIILGRDLMEL